MSETNNLPTTVTEETELMTLSITNAVHALKPNERLIALKNDVDKANADIATIAKEYKTNPIAFLDKHDEESLQRIISDGDALKNVNKDIDKAKKAIRSFYESEKKAALELLQSYLDADSLLELDANLQTMKDIKDDLKFRRAEKRWKELEPTFLAALSHYPIIASIAPELQDFTTFQLREPRCNGKQLVTGAVSRSVSKTRAEGFIRDTIDDWAKGLEAYQANGHELSPKYNALLLQEFKQNPSGDFIFERSAELKQVQNLEEEKAREAEIARQKELERRRQEALEAERKAKELAEQQAQAKKEAEAAAKNAKQVAQTQTNTDIVNNAQLQAEQAQLAAEALNVQAKAAQKEAKQLKATVSAIPVTTTDTKFPNYVKQLRQRNEAHPISGRNDNKVREVYRLTHALVDKSSPIRSEILKPGTDEIDFDKVMELIRYVINL